MAGDTDEDGLLTRDELSAATFGSYDRNRDEVLDEEEWSLFEYDERVRNRPFADSDAIRRNVSK